MNIKDLATQWMLILLDSINVSLSFEWGLPDGIEPGEAFVLHFYDEADKLMIWANGVEIYNGPMPLGIIRNYLSGYLFEPIHHQFLYGKSLPDKLANARY